MIGLEPGALFCGRYKIIKAIGAGGMGAVYLASESRHNDFLVALKILYPGIIKSPEAKERFRNEIIASYRVSHKNIVRAYEYFDEQDFQAYSMEYVDGGDLLQKMRDGRVPIPEVIDILSQIASGLSAIHSEGILHRDLKPENILLTSKGEVKITDFGVARLRGSSNLTQVGAMVGTPKYLAPEYVETGECDHRADIYAAGVIGYELITGKSPFRSESKVSLMVERLRSRVEPAERIVSDCPTDLSKVIARAMNVSVNRRYQSAAEFERDLKLIAEGKRVAFPSEVTETNLNSPSLVSTALRLTKEKAPKLYWKLTSLVFYYDEIARWIRGVSKGNKILFALFTFILASEVVLRAFYLGAQGTKGSITFDGIPLGAYRGSMNGVLADKNSYPFAFWRTDAGSFILFGKEGCKIQKLDSSGKFRCGDLLFEIEMSSLEKGKAAGTVKELGFGTVGTWNLGESEEVKR